MQQREGQTGDLVGGGPTCWNPTAVVVTPGLDDSNQGEESGPRCDAVLQPYAPAEGVTSATRLILNTAHFTDRDSEAQGRAAVPGDCRTGICIEPVWLQRPDPVPPG